MEVFAYVIIGIIVFIVFIISAVAKKKSQTSGQQDEPARPTMTDIQKAFMMAAGLPVNEESSQSRPTAYAPRVPVAAPYEPQYPAAPAYPVQSSVLKSYAGNFDEDSSVFSNPYMGTQISSYFKDEEDAEPAIRQSVPVNQQTSADQLTLFENQTDIVKAVIYSEILSCKGRRAR